MHKFTHFPREIQHFSRKIREILAPPGFPRHRWHPPRLSEGSPLRPLSPAGPSWQTMGKWGKIPWEFLGQTMMKPKSCCLMGLLELFWSFCFYSEMQLLGVAKRTISWKRQASLRSFWRAFRSWKLVRTQFKTGDFRSYESSCLEFGMHIFWEDDNNSPACAKHGHFGILPIHPTSYDFLLQSQGLFLGERIHYHSIIIRYETHQ